MSDKAQAETIWPDYRLDAIADSDPSYLVDVAIVNPELAAHLKIKADFYRAAALARLDLFGSCDGSKS